MESAVAAIEESVRGSAAEEVDDDGLGSLASEDLLAAMEEIEAAVDRAAGENKQLWGVLILWVVVWLL